jgi:hypothetical protein
MRLNTLHAKLTTAQRRVLAEQVGVTETYLWQIATRWRGKRASLSLIERLAVADKRLKRADMLAEFTEPAAQLS